MKFNFDSTQLTVSFKRLLYKHPKTPFFLTRLNEIIKKAQNGNDKAFKDLFDTYSAMVYGICLRYMKDDIEAKDLMQEVFIRFFSKIKNFHYKGSFEGWIKKMTVNMAIDELRRMKLLEFKEPINNYSQESDFISNEVILSNLAFKDLLELVKQLPKVYGIVFNMYVLEGYKHAEISEILGISEGTSKSNLHDARRILQEKLLTLMNG